MTNTSHGRRPAVLAAALLLGISLTACTTTEGTNALTDIGTFEREVMTSTVQGLGLVPREQKDENIQARGPLVLPRDASTLPAPRESSVAALPANSDTVQIDTTRVSEEDLRRMRNARVVDTRTLNGRPLTEAETRQLTARMQQNNIGFRTNTNRPLYLPPDEYFTTVKGQDLICLATNGDLVPVNDPACPPQIRAALARN